MADIFRGSERITPGFSRFSDNGRFELTLQSDGNLVVYAYFTEPKPVRYAVWNSETQHLGPNIYVTIGTHLSEPSHHRISQLEFRENYHDVLKKIFPGSKWSKNPRLCLLDDANLVLYSDDPEHNPSGPSGRAVLWLSGQTVSDQRNAIPPKAAVINLPPGSLGIPNGNRTIENGTDERLVIRDNSNSVILEREQVTTINSPNVLSIEVIRYNFTNGSSDATVRTDIQHDQKVIRVTGSYAGGFGLS